MGACKMSQELIQQDFEALFNSAADRTINSLGACDDEFNQWHLDHGNLRHLFHQIWQAAAARYLPKEGEAVEEMANVLLKFICLTNKSYGDCDIQPLNRKANLALGRYRAMISAYKREGA